MGYDWTDVIEEACGDAKLSATKDQIETIAAWAEGHHDNYSMSHGYDCIGNVSESMEITSLKAKIKELEGELELKKSSQQEFLDRKYGKGRVSGMDQFGYLIPAR